MELLENIEADITQFRSIESELLRRRRTPREKFPGVAYANASINPINRLMVQLTSQMIQSEMEEAGRDPPRTAWKHR